MISALAFIPRGAAKETPEQQELSAEEMDMLIQKQAGMSLSQLDEDAPDAAAASAVAKSATAAGDSDAEMDDEEEKKADAEEEGMDDKEAQLLKELKMGKKRETRERRERKNESIG